MGGQVWMGRWAHRRMEVGGREDEGDNGWIQVTAWGGE